MFEKFIQQFPEIKVPASLRAPLPVVTATLAGLKHSVQERRRLLPGNQDKHYFPRLPDDQACLDVYVTRPNFERAVRFLDALFKVFQGCGFKTPTVWDAQSRSVRLEVLHDRFRLRLA